MARAVQPCLDMPLIGIDVAAVGLSGAKVTLGAGLGAVVGGGGLSGAGGLSGTEVNPSDLFFFSVDLSRDAAAACRSVGRTVSYHLRLYGLLVPALT